jgi:hypothetical protein
MATVSVVKLKVRRGSDAERKLITLDNGELGYVTDAASKRLFVGDGVTQGGYPASTKLYYGGSVATGTNLATAQVGDIIFSTSDNKLYALTGTDAFNFPNYGDPAAYQFIGPRADNRTVTYNGAGQLTVQTTGISASQVNSDVFDLTQGFSRASGTGKVSVNYDGVKIRIVSGSLSVHEPSLNVNDLNFVGKNLTWSNLALFSLPDSSTVGSLRTGQVYYELVTGILKVKL